MIHRRPSLPFYRLHKASRQAVVTLNGHEFYLGKHGTAASREAYDRLIAKWPSNNRHVSCRRHAEATEATVAEVLAAYLRFAREYYVKEGVPYFGAGPHQVGHAPAASPLWANSETKRQTKQLAAS
jgi:hypothetical protein